MTDYSGIDDIPQWELDAIAEVEMRWDLNGTDAENFLVHEGVFE